MITAIRHLQNAMGYAKFKDENIKKAALALLTELDNELTTEDYEPSDDVEGAALVLEAAINDSDDSAESTAHVAGSDDDDEEFAGLGDDEDDDKN